MKHIIALTLAVFTTVAGVTSATAGNLPPQSEAGFVFYPDIDGESQFVFYPNIDGESGFVFYPDLDK